MKDINQTVSFKKTTIGIILEGIEILMEEKGYELVGDVWVKSANNFKHK